MPSLGYCISGKEVEVHGSGSRYHLLCGCCNLQLIQSHVATSHGPPARVLSPLFFLAKSLMLPKPRGKKKHSKTTRSSLFPSEPHGPPYSLQNRMVLPIHSRTAWSSSFPSEPRGLLPTCFRTSWFSHLLQSHVVSSSLLKPCGPPHYFEAVWSLFFLWLPGLGLNPSAHLPLQPHF